MAYDGCGSLWLGTDVAVDVRVQTDAADVRHGTFERVPGRKGLPMNYTTTIRSFGIENQRRSSLTQQCRVSTCPCRWKCHTFKPVLCCEGVCGLVLNSLKLCLCLGCKDRPLVLIAIFVTGCLQRPCKVVSGLAPRLGLRCSRRTRRMAATMTTVYVVCDGASTQHSTGNVHVAGLWGSIRCGLPVKTNVKQYVMHSLLPD